jgi:hypothetical protein
LPRTATPVAPSNPTRLRPSLAEPAGGCHA